MDRGLPRRVPTRLRHLGCYRLPAASAHSYVRQPQSATACTPDPGLGPAPRIGAPFAGIVDPVNNPYLELTAAFNQGRLRALLSSGQAVVVHRLAIMSKDGDWVLREDAEAVTHILGVLADRGARYRFGAPLDLRWLAGGWSAHLEMRTAPLRLRTDFVTRPPRIDPAWLARIWAAADATGNDVVDPVALAALKLTDREKDYAVIGELARLMTDPRDQLRYCRSSRDLVELAARYPADLAEAVRHRPLLARIAAGREALDEELDRERRAQMRVNEERLQRYRAAAEGWAAQWPALQSRIEGLPLLAAHQTVTAAAESALPMSAGPGGVP
jgi:hypothetical protein